MKFAFAIVAMTAILASAYDTYQSRCEYERQISIIIRDYKIQQAEAGDVAEPTPFSPEELRAIKTQNTKFFGTLAFKAVLAIILLALIFGGGLL